jgi:hypothetical protein
MNRLNDMTAQRAERARLFRMVRDIPYYIALGDEQDYCCVTKPFMLERLLSTVGVKSRHIICTFRWSDLPLPQSVIGLAHDDEDTHEFLEVHCSDLGRWVRVDPNWDSGVSRLGLTVSDWKGDDKDTPIAVTPVSILSPEDSTKLIAEEDEIDPEVRAAYLDQNRTFFDSLNRWLAEARASH